MIDEKAVLEAIKKFPSKNGYFITSPLLLKPFVANGINVYKTLEVLESKNLIKKKKSAALFKDERIVGILIKECNV